ncbi:MAG: HAMP domain-containing sensor histidine kinase [Actinomycetota bacterium]
MHGPSLPRGGVVATVERSGRVTASSDEAILPVGGSVLDWAPDVEVDRTDEVQALTERATTLVVHAGEELVVDLEVEREPELVTLRWLDEVRSALRDATTVDEGAALVLAAVGEQLGVDAVELRSLDTASRRWTATAGPVGRPPAGAADDLARRWTSHAHLVSDVAIAPTIDASSLERSAIARPPASVLGDDADGPAAVVSFPLRHAGLHRGELVAWAARPIGPHGAHLRTAIITVLDDLAVRGVREAEGTAAGDVLEAVGHDLRSPLRAVANYAELLSGAEGPDDDVLDFTVRMRTAARQANEQLDGLVEFLDVGLDADTRSIVLDRLFDQIEASWTSSINGVRIRRSGSLGEVVAGPRLGQALGILVENSVAVRRSPDVVTLTVAAEPMGGGGRRITLTDDGPGRLRELTAFRWSDGSRSTSTVGPVLARRIVEREGGRLRAEAVEGAATTWTIELPGR